MKQVTDRVVALAKALVTSAQQSEEDSFITLGRTCSQIVELPDPTRSFLTPPLAGPRVSENFAEALNINTVGVHAAQNIPGNSFSPGLWRIKGVARFSYANAGNGNFLGAMRVSILDPDTIAFDLANDRYTTTHNTTVMFDHLFSFVRTDGFFQWSISADATLAAESITVDLTAFCTKLF